MSLIPGPNVVCHPPKTRRRAGDVAGTANAILGYRMRSVGRCQVEKDRHEKKFVEDPREARERARFRDDWDFQRESDRKIQCRTAHRRVREGMARYEEELNARRERLRDLLRQEEAFVTKEIADRGSRERESRTLEIRERWLRSREERESARSALAASKRMQQYLERCPEFRARLWRANARDAKLSNLAQIGENRTRREAEKELESLWRELELEEIRAERERDAETARRRRSRDREIVASLDEQVAGKLALEERRKRERKEDREHLERLWENVRLEEVRRLESERRRRESLKRDLEEQIVATKRSLAERAREEIDADRILTTIAREDSERERTKRLESIASLRAELIAYLRYLEELRAEEARRNIEVDAIIEQSAKDDRTRRELATRRLEAVRETSSRDVRRALDEQVKARRELRDVERRALEEERIQVQKEVELETSLRERRRAESIGRAQRYREDLRRQLDYVEATRRREAEEEARIRRNDRDREEEYRKLTEELLKASEEITPHPFKVILKQAAERRDAEKEGRCYCPPPLPPE